MRSLEALWSFFSDVIGRTLMPASPIRNGYSFVPVSYTHLTLPTNREV